jgi:N-acetylglucosamine repressor
MPKQTASRSQGSAHAITMATPQTMRRVNRAIILNLIRNHQPVSRPQLAELSGVHRSNVSLIVDELIQDGLLTEQFAEPKGRGRAPKLVSLVGSSVYVIAISVRVALTTVVLGALNGQTERLFCFETPEDPRDFVALFRQNLELVRTRTPALRQGLRQVVISVPGKYLPPRGLHLPALPLYDGFALRERIERIAAAPTLVANNGNLAALGGLAHLHKGKRHAHDFVYVTIGHSVVGGGVVLNRKLYAGHDGNYTADFGHMSIGIAPKCHCGNLGCWGEMICNRTVWNHYAPKSRFSSAKFSELLDRAVEGDAAAVKAVRAIVPDLMRGLRNIAMCLNPEQIIVAGEITRAWSLIQADFERTGFLSDVPTTVSASLISLDDLFETGAVQRALQQIFHLPEVEVPF